MVDYYKESVPSNNGRSMIEVRHFNAGSIGTSQDTIISGDVFHDFDKVSVMSHLVDAGQASGATLQLFESNESGATAPTVAISGGNTWAQVGTDITITSGGVPDLSAFEVTNAKWIALTAKTNAATSGGLKVDLMIKSKY